MTVSTVGAFGLHLLCGLGLAASLSVARNIYSANLISDPDRTLLILFVIECPIVIVLYSLFRQNPAKCSYLRAVGRGLLSLPIGALVISLGAITLGAPVSIKYLWRTIYWSLLMSLFTFVPAASVFGSSWVDWQRIFANTRPAGTVDYMVCLPAHCAVIGSWFGAWPMPLDWERPWQEWPICVTYGALIGYTIGIIASLVFVIHRNRLQHVKEE